MVETKHIPVMLEEVLGVLNVSAGKVYIDATVGGGGFSREILKRSSPDGTLIGLDRDAQSLEKAEEELEKDFDKKRFYLFHLNFNRIDEAVRSAGFNVVDGIVLDLGISSIQLEGGRGFSFKEEGFLDMRMDRDEEITAFKIINDYPEKVIADILWKYGNERFSRRIARKIVEYRKKKPVETPVELSEIINKAVFRGKKNYKIDNSTRTFMALRIAVNKEYESLQGCLEKIKGILVSKGIIAIISFHSGEDRIVKNFFRNDPDFRPVFKKLMYPSEKEIKINPRSRSAKLRAFYHV